MHSQPPNFPLRHAQIWGAGVDLCQIERVQAAYARQGERLLQRLLTPAEQSVFHQRQSENAARGVQYLAGRFAAKEALAKALGTGIRSMMGFQAASILSDELGKPWVQTHGELTKMFEREHLLAHISLSDEADLVLAYCVIEKRG
jgi:holo-[acyl-carrier-protein] synthase